MSSADPLGWAPHPTGDPRILEFDAPEEVVAQVRNLATPALLRDSAHRVQRTLASRVGDGSRGLGAYGSRSSSGPRKVLCINVDEVPASQPLWFVGDVHGDLQALESALEHIVRMTAGEGREALIVFLGDLVDDGVHSYEVVVRVLQLLCDASASVVYLPGNHDEALDYDSHAGAFVSSVVPGDFADWLNAYAGDDRDTVHAVARLFIDVVGLSPRALFLWDGLLVAHGGIPQRDVWESLRTLPDFEQPECLQDFVWTRASERARKRLPDRTTKGAEFGSEDFAAFCELAERTLGQPVRRMIRGHDHFPERFSLYRNYATHRILTINTMGRPLPRERDDGEARWPCVARWIPGALPEVHRLQLRREPEPAGSEGSSGALEQD